MTPLWPIRGGPGRVRALSAPRHGAYLCVVSERARLTFPIAIMSASLVERHTPLDARGRSVEIIDVDEWVRNPPAPRHPAPGPSGVHPAPSRPSNRGNAREVIRVDSSGDEDDEIQVVQGPSNPSARHRAPRASVEPSIRHRARARCEQCLISSEYIFLPHD